MNDVMTNRDYLSVTRSDAAQVVRELETALEAARTIRDRAAAAYERGLRSDDNDAMAAAMNTLYEVHRQLDGHTAHLLKDVVFVDATAEDSI